jgi:putative membrane protein
MMKQLEVKKGVMIKLSCLIVAVIFAAACSSNGSLTAMRQVDRDFVLKASEANIAEIEIGEIAIANATTPEVRTFAEMMRTDHQSALDDLKSIANDKNTGITLSINFDHQKIKQDLAQLNGYVFDTAYMQSRVRDIGKTIAIFETEISTGSDSQIVDYATEYLMHLQRHRQQADSISSLIKKSN